MKKIITAINNPQLNEELKKEENFEIIGKDVQYKEAILEVLEKNNTIDLIIVNEKIPGEINLEILIKKIKLINEKIKIIFILEKENNELEKILIKNKIIDIYYNNKINLKELIKIINKKEMNMEEEIIKLKKIIEEKNIKDKVVEKKIKEANHFWKEKIAEVKSKRRENMSTKIITFSGNHKSGKTTLALIISQQLSQKNYKVLLVDGDMEKQDLSFILNKERNGNFKNKKTKSQKRNFENFYKTNKKKNFNKSQLNKINRNKELIKRKNFFKNKKIRNNKQIKKKKYFINKKNKIYSYKIMKSIKKDIKKISKNLDLFYGLNNLFKNKNRQNEKKVSFVIYHFLENVKEKYDYIIIDLSKNNLRQINIEFLKNSELNFIFLESNLLGVKEFKELYENYKKEREIKENSLHIVLNKKNILSINKRLIAKTISYKNKIFEIKENKFYYFCINHSYKRKIILKNKTIKSNLNKIINKITN